MKLLHRSKYVDLCMVSFLRDQCAGMEGFPSRCLHWLMGKRSDVVDVQ